MAGYLVAAVWWPDGWEPGGPLDVPRCLAFVRPEVPGNLMTHDQALATVRGLNQQNMDHPGAAWYVVAVVKDEPGTPAVAAAGKSGQTIASSRLEVAPAEGAGRGDCSHCPARDFPCATHE